ncbi:MAG: hypothetical protein A4S09_10610 [Proteobacteria bacterium SG_bin7]|nr:MAG: hypothetical protein A4S09_10610 [Proteobacteria bacterium SG_bin7]
MTLKFILALIVTVSFQVFADEKEGSAEATSDLRSEAGLSSDDCDPAKQVAATLPSNSQDSPAQAPGVKPGRNAEPRDHGLLEKNSNMMIAAVSNDPFGSPCRYR